MPEGLVIPATGELAGEARVESAPVRVLLVEDDADDYTLTRDMLSESDGKRFHLDWVATYDAALEQIRRQEHDVYLLDYRLGERNGLELLREAVRLGARAPMILITGQDDRTVDMEAMRAGAADYVIKEHLDAPLLERSIRYAIEHKRTEEELERRVQQRTAELARANRILEIEVAERKRAEAQLKASLREKEVLLRELHHRVKNNLQVVCSLLNLQARYVDDRRALEMFKECQGRVRSMALIHQKLCQSENLARIDLGHHIRDLATNLMLAHGIESSQVALEVAVEDAVLSLDTVVPATLLLHELISNVLKHAFPDGRRGLLRIELHPEAPDAGGKRFHMMVSDNGAGLPAELDFRTASSLGLQLICALADQLEGTLAVSRANGTTVTLSFRDVRYKERG
jgi:two-component sensor histidine kinase/FixJ family two-component response regulator